MVSNRSNNQHMVESLHGDANEDVIDQTPLLDDDSDCVSKQMMSIDANELYSLRLIALKLVAIAICDVIVFLAASTGRIQWAAFDFSRHVNDIGILVCFRTLFMLMLSLGSVIDSQNGSAQKLLFITHWVNFSILTCSVGKLIVFDWKDNQTALSYVAVFGWIVFGFVERQIIAQLRNVLLERTRWVAVCDEDNSIEHSMERGDHYNSRKLFKKKKLVDTSEKADSQNWLSSYFFRVLKPYFWPKKVSSKLCCMMTWVFLIISKVTALLSPIYFGRAVQGLAQNGVSDTNVFYDILVFAILSLASRIFKEMQNAIYLSVKQIAYVEVAESTFWHLHSLSLEWHLKKKMGNMLRSMDRGVLAANTLVTFLFLNVGPSLIECIIVFVIFYTHFQIPLLSATAFVFFTAYGVLTIKITLWRKKFRTLTVKHDNDYHDRATDSLINYETVKYFTAEKFETERYIESVSKFQNYTTSTAYSLSVLNGSQSIIMQICTGLCLCIAANEVRKGRLEIGGFSSVSVYISNLFAPLNFLGTMYNGIIQAIVDMSNLVDLLKEEPDMVDLPGATPMKIPANGASIEFRNVTFRYPTAHLNSGLKNISFSVKPGTITAICGSTGSGKSTIARLLFRFYDPIAGQVSISNQNIKYVTQVSLRQMIGVVPQDTVLFNETILHNIKYGRRDVNMKEIERACESAQIMNFIRSLPDGFNTMVGERGLRLSGGEKQRISIARCLLKDPPIVILDEATSALDSSTERSVQTALNGLSAKRTSIVIAHRLTTIRNSDQIIVLSDGRILEKGKHDELIEIQGEYARLWSASSENQDDSIEEDETTK